MSSRLLNWLNKNRLTPEDFKNDPAVCARYVTFIRKKADQFKNKYCLPMIEIQHQSRFDEFISQ